MRNIERHTTNAEPTRQVFEESIPTFMGLFDRTPSMLLKLSMTGGQALSFLEGASVFAREHELLFPAARLLAQARTGAVLHGTVKLGTPVEFAIGERRVTMTGAGPQHSSGIGAWRDGWFGALMAREQPALDTLRGVSDQVLESCAKYDGYHYAWKKALLAVDSNPDQAVKFAAEAVDLTAPKFSRIAKPGVPEFAATIFPLLRGIAERNGNVFNDSLVAALEAHKARYQEEPADPSGWMAFGPQALCCLAHDRGIQVEVESDYLLPKLIRRQ